jgi:hypothetical protein
MRPLLVLLVCGCAHTPDRDTVCRMAQLERNNIVRMSPGELSFAARGTPAEFDASSARAQIITAQVFGAIGSAALVAGLIEGFAADPATNPAARTSAYSLAGGALGLFAGALVLGLTSRKASERARAELKRFADRCGESL